VDFLIILRDPPDHKLRNRISSMVLAIDLEYDTNLSGLVVDQKAWDGVMLSVLLIHAEVTRQGIRL
jgi:hypothetical protein